MEAVEGEAKSHGEQWTGKPLSVWQINSKMACNDPCLLVFTPLCNSRLLSVSRTCNSLLIKNGPGNGMPLL